MHARARDEGGRVLAFTPRRDMLAHGIRQDARRVISLQQQHEEMSTPSLCRKVEKRSRGRSQGNGAELRRPTAEYERARLLWRADGAASRALWACRAAAWLLRQEKPGERESHVAA